MLMTVYIGGFYQRQGGRQWGGITYPKIWALEAQFQAMHMTVLVAFTCLKHIVHVPVPKGHLERLKCGETVFRRSAPDPAGGAYSAPQTL